MRFSEEQVEKLVSDLNKENTELLRENAELRGFII